MPSSERNSKLTWELEREGEVEKSVERDENEAKRSKDDGDAEEAVEGVWPGEKMVDRDGDGVWEGIEAVGLDGGSGDTVFEEEEDEEDDMLPMLDRLEDEKIGAMMLDIQNILSQFETKYRCLGFSEDHFDRRLLLKVKED